ncbi:MAG: hypothetical protein J5711_05835 [Bacteroidales bacterium]|nr:hypothetical protein [Bacteroidales bacterium]
MKTIKQIGQVLAAIVYTCLYTGLVYLIIVLPMAWYLSLSTKMMILVFVFLGGILEYLLIGLNVFLLMPYGWIVKNNIVALIVSLVLVITNFVLNDIMVWRSTYEYGTTGIIIAIVITLLIVQAISMIIWAIYACYENQ